MNDEEYNCTINSFILLNIREEKKICLLNYERGNLFAPDLN